MAEWMWYANTGRLKHLALTRESAASRHYARLNTLLLAAALAVFEVTRTGWRQVHAWPELEPTGSTVPAGAAWLHVVGVPRPLPEDHVSEIPVDLWWNPVQALIAVGAAAVAGLFLMWLVKLLARAGTERALKPSYRREERMTAAILYSTAWVIPVSVAALVLMLRPLSYIGSMAQWPWFPPDEGLVLSAAVLAGFGFTMWWFWLVRLGASMPANTRARVVALFALGPPIMLAGVAAGWWYGLDALYEQLFGVLNISF